MLTSCWPSGIVQEFRDVEPNQVLRAIEPDRPLTEAELADAMRLGQGELGNNERPSADDSPAATASVDFYNRPDVDMTVVYDRASGRVAFEGSDWHKYITINMEITGDDANPPDIHFDTQAAGWSQQDVYSFVDEETRQGYESYVGCIGKYVVRGGQTFDGLLPAGLDRQQVLDQLKVQYTLAGVPGTRQAVIKVIPEPSTWILAVLGLLLAITQARRMRIGRARYLPRKFVSSNSDCLLSGEPQ